MTGFGGYELGGIDEYWIEKRFDRVLIDPAPGKRCGVDRAPTRCLSEHGVQGRNCGGSFRGVF